MIELELTDKISPFLSTDKRIKVAFGGRGGTKSQSIVDILLYKVAQGKKVGCFREHQNTIEDSVHALIKDEIERLGIPGYSVQKTYIDHMSGGMFRFKGLARNLMGVKSAHGFDIFFIEEGQFLSEDSLRILIPTLRTAGSELWIILNPESRQDPVSKRYIMPFYKTLLKDSIYVDDHLLIVWTNYDENPWFPKELEADRLRDYEMLSRAEYDHIWRGHFLDDIENSIIKAEWFDAAVDADKKLNFGARGVDVVSHDPSDLGLDDKAICHRHGSCVLACKSRAYGDVNDGMDWALDYVIDKSVDLFTWDCDGMGVSLNRQVKQALKPKQINFQMYKGSMGVDNPETIYQGVTGSANHKTNKQTFKNKRAQKIWSVRDRFYNTYLAVEKGIYTDPDYMISISSDIDEIEQLRAETCRIPRKYNPNGLIQIHSKPEMKRIYSIDSPNLFDSLVMAFEVPANIYEDIEHMEFVSLWA